MLVYKATNKLNGECYIGKTINCLEKRIYRHRKSVEYGSSSYFHNALRKYGFDNFKWEIIEKCENKKELDEREIYHIDINKSSYNMTKGGDGGPIMFGKNNPMHRYKGMSYEEIWGKEKSIEKKRKISNGLIKLKDNHPSKRKDVKEKLKKTHSTDRVIELKRKKMLSFGNNHPMKRPEVISKNTESKIKKWKIHTPEGKVLLVRNMKLFCEKNNLSNSNMTLVSQGKRKHHKGYVCELARR